MSSVINPIPTAASGALQILPFATNPPSANVEPSAGLIDAGYAPAPDAPDYHNANYILNKQSALNSRGIQTALFVEEAYASVLIAGLFGVGQNRRITINGNNIDDIGAILDTAVIVATRFVAAINSNALVNTRVFASRNLGFVNITGIVPGRVFTLAVAVLAGDPADIAIFDAPVQPIIRVDAGGTANAYDPQNMNVVIGSPQADTTGGANDAGRIVWRKAKNAFRAGRWLGAEADDANTGASSVAFGEGTKASGTYSMAAGHNAVASGTESLALAGGSAVGNSDIAIGTSSSANRGAGAAGVAIGNQASSAAGGVAVGPLASAPNDNALAVGNGAGTGGADAIAIGTAAAGNSTQAIAIGKSTTASAASAIAIGNTANATASNGVAVGPTTIVAAASGTAVGLSAQANVVGGVALGSSCRANGAQASIAIGRGVRTTGQGALGSGETTSNNDVLAAGRGARAHGAARSGAGLVDAYVVASGEGADAMGDNVEASADFSSAYGTGAGATNRGEWARSCVTDTPTTSQKGMHQIGIVVVQARTTNATSTKLCTDVLTGAGTSWTPADDRGLAVRYRAIAKQGNGTAAALWEGVFFLTKDAGVLDIPATCGITNTATIAPTFNFGASGTWTLKFTKSGGTLQLEGTGSLLTVVDWTCAFHYTQAGEDY